MAECKAAHAAARKRVPKPELDSKIETLKAERNAAAQMLGAAKKKAKAEAERIQLPPDWRPCVEAWQAAAQILKMARDGARRDEDPGFDEGAAAAELAAFRQFCANKRIRTRHPAPGSSGKWHGWSMSAAPL
jgi:hypothetical protein